MSVRRLISRVMPDVACRHHEDDVLGDVRGVIADPLEMAGNQNQVERRFDGVRIVLVCAPMLAFSGVFVRLLPSAVERVDRWWRFGLLPLCAAGRLSMRGHR